MASLTRFAALLSPLALLGGCDTDGAVQCPSAKVSEAQAIAIAIDRSQEQVDGGYRIGQSAYPSEEAIDPRTCCSATKEQHVVSGKEVWQVLIETPVRDGTATLLVNIDPCGEQVDATSMLTRGSVGK